MFFRAMSRVLTSHIIYMYILYVYMYIHAPSLQSTPPVFLQGIDEDGRFLTFFASLCNIRYTSLHHLQRWYLRPKTPRCYCCCEGLPLASSINLQYASSCATMWHVARIHCRVAWNAYIYIYISHCTYCHHHRGYTIIVALVVGLRWLGVSR